MYHLEKRHNLRQFVKDVGIPHVFFTFSLDESNSTDLFDYILQQQTTNIHANSDILLHIQPPFLATLYNYEKLMGIVKYMKANGLGKHKLKDYFLRFEFQESGSFHIHMLCWFGILNIEELLDLISCEIPDYKEEPALNAIVRRSQIHKCKKRYCKKKTGKCRFKYPKQPCKESKFIINLF